jgi:hypothetical protein
MLHKFCALFSIFIIFKNNDQKRYIYVFYVGNNIYYNIEIIFLPKNIQYIKIYIIKRYTVLKYVYIFIIIVSSNQIWNEILKYKNILFVEEICRKKWKLISRMRSNIKTLKKIYIIKFLKYSYLNFNFFHWKIINIENWYFYL